ncbi:hypothetical protein HYT52_03050 [Candidatus Woesearchaeota archaeon]|nr:hypothetical protein [Candidatus Woesearchaeota archaeon]
MAYFIISLKNGDEVKITESEYKQLGGKSGLIFFPSIGQTINIDPSTIIRIYPENNTDKLLDRRNSKFGILHDGTPVMRYFGTWYLGDGTRIENPKTGIADRPEKMIDPTYYPEVARDCVPTREEYEKEYASLPREKRLEAILGVYNRPSLGKGGFKQLGDIIN